MPKLRSPATVLALVLGLVGLIVVLYAWRLPPFATTLKVTENAYVRGQVTVLAPLVAGHVAEVPVQDYQAVKAGDVLVRLDDRTLRGRLAQAKAQLEVQKAELASSEQARRSAEANIAAAEAQVSATKTALDAAQAAWDRMSALLNSGVATLSAADSARVALESARATHGQALAALEVARQNLASVVVGRQSLEAAVAGAAAAYELAKVDLENATIVAPVDGRLGEVTARVGQYAPAGTQLATLVPEHIWVVANFKETQIAGMRIGQPVSFTVDALAGARMTGSIERFAPATGSEFSVLKPDNATGNFTKIVRRLPVRITIDPGQPSIAKLVPGMSVVVTVDTAADMASK